MSGGGPRNVQQTSTTSLPAWLQPYAQQFLQTYTGQVSPGNPLAAGGAQLAPYDPSMYRQVAPFTPTQQAGMGSILGATGPSAQLAGAGAGALGRTVSGQYLTGNPYLDAMYGQAAGGLTDQYRLATAPSNLVQSQQGGVFGGSAAREQQAANQYGLGRNLSDLAAQIYGGNYQQERARQLQAAQLIPTEQGALMQPGQAQLGVGTLQQGQTQTALDVASQNAIGRNQWPFTLLSGLGAAIGQAGGGTGMLTASGPNPNASKF